MAHTAQSRARQPDERYAALLRGINVGGSRKVPMAELRTVLEGLGHRDVATYLQSGNAVFTAPRQDPGALARALEQAIEAHFGFAVACLVLDGDRLAEVAAQCPYPAAELEGRQLHATFLSEQPAAGRLDAVDPAQYAPEDYRLGDRVIYLYVPDGLGRSRLAEALARPALLKGITATTRNWNTVAKLVGLTAGPAD
ncbi:DUF1697 domain-containing protein [Streptomyces bambusae]|uniref:DUF1697 domain-containing protein n=1 Tax=Streptomyces bambusae TaxID=1550616 RepID=UPI001CFE6A94|nr:DUF1697 domain-containing protein [Streptomyces bambusae]MCB5165605.1 DUF1697 domain-containing protein [Streptomyces bambusae]